MSIRKPSVTHKLIIIGSGPAGLMAATEASRVLGSGKGIAVLERRAGLGRKLLIAGSSGLNISHDLPVDQFSAQYEGFSKGFWQALLTEFGVADWIGLIEKDLGLATFKGSSSRYFVREMKASHLLKGWTEWLRERGVEFIAQTECSGLEALGAGIGPWRVLHSGSTELIAERVILALGGGSWEDAPPVWPEWLHRHGVEITPWSAANCGYEIAWPEGLLKEAEGKPLKRIVFGNSKGSRAGELVITRYGLEGTPIYQLGEPGPAWIDLKPDLIVPQLVGRLEREAARKIAPIRRAQRELELGEAGCALLFHMSTPAERADARELAKRIKRIEFRLLKPRPLQEAISSRGGVVVAELTPRLELSKMPGVYCAGEMIDWHAPTGGFLIQAAVSMGARVGRAAAAGLGSPASDGWTPGV